MTCDEFKEMAPAYVLVALDEHERSACAHHLATGFPHRGCREAVAAAELVAAATISLADIYGLPVSTTQVLSSGVAGTMAANGSGLQAQTVKNLVMAWVLTLPVSIMLSAFLYFLFSHLF